MIDALPLILLGIYAPIIIALGWYTYCTRRTFFERMHIIEWARGAAGTEEFYRRLAYVKDITFEQHLWARFKLQDPYALYEVDPNMGWDK